MRRQSQTPTRTKHTILKAIVAIIAALAVDGYVAAVAAQQSAPNNLFTAAGFAVRYGNTPEKLAHLRRLPPDKLVTRTRRGKLYYIYADPNGCVCAYVGSPEAYQAYKSGSSAGSQFNLGGSDSPESQVVEAFEQNDAPSEAGALSFNDYVFGGMRDDP
jgi:hypothetical protein